MRLPDQFLNQVNFITVTIVIITNSSIITIINVFKILLKTLHYNYFYHCY